MAYLLSSRDKRLFRRDSDAGDLEAAASDGGLAIQGSHRLVGLSGIHLLICRGDKAGDIPLVDADLA